MKEQLLKIKESAIEKLNEATSLKVIEDIRVSITGKKGELTAIMKTMGALSKEERPVFGQKVNEVRDAIEELITTKYNELKTKEMKSQFEKEKIDVTAPGKVHKLGTRHPLTIAMEEIKTIFLGMGYKIAEGPDIETKYYNFEALNIPDTHPARDEQDTFYLGEYLLRTQTSPVQIREMEKGNLPIKLIAPGRVYRSDEVDATHSPVFHQIEGLVIDKGVTMADLKGTLLTFARELFGHDVNIRLRPHYFPFTEPSAEMDISCFVCGGKDSSCKVCRGEGYIELLGCGMVHPKVLKMAGIDPEVYSGFAFGMGLERIAMQRYNIEDLRLFYENDIRFLKQF